VGLTQRSNAEGIRQLAVTTEHYGYDLTAVPVTGCLHLKSAVTYLGRNTLLGNRECSTGNASKALTGWMSIPPKPTPETRWPLANPSFSRIVSEKRAARIEAKAFRVESLDISIAEGRVGPHLFQPSVRRSMLEKRPLR